MIIHSFHFLFTWSSFATTPATYGSQSSKLAYITSPVAIATKLNEMNPAANIQTALKFELIIQNHKNKQDLVNYLCLFAVFWSGTESNFCMQLCALPNMVIHKVVSPITWVQNVERTNGFGLKLKKKPLWDSNRIRDFLYKLEKYQSFSAIGGCPHIQWII